jgi:hypothetical protein
MLLFLDIDGVMVPAKSWQRPTLLEDGFPEFSPKAVAVLQKIISKDTFVILTTSHRSRYTLNEWKRILSRRGIQVKNLSRLRSYKNKLSRKDELLRRFNNNIVSDDVVIIDDDKSLNDLPINLKERLVQTQSFIGLTESHEQKLKELLNGNKSVSVPANVI